MLLFIPPSFSAYLREQRLKLGFSQGCLARRADLTIQRLSAFECGKRSPNPEELARLATALNTTGEELRANTDWLAGARPPFPGRRRFGAIRRFEPHRERETYVRLLAAWKRFPERSQALQALIHKRPDRGAVRAGLRRVCVQSAEEALLLLHLVGADGTLEEVSPQVASFRQHPIIDPETQEVVGDCLFPAVYLRLGPYECVVFFQVTVRAVKTYRPDCLLGVRWGSRMLWIDLEVDGDGHDPTYDGTRQEHLSLPTIRLSQKELNAPNLREILKERIREEFPGLDSPKAA